MYHKVKRLKRKMFWLGKRWSRAFGCRYLQSQRVIIFYDGWCPMCQHIQLSLKRIDYFRLLTCVSFRMPQVMERYNLDPEEVEKRMHSVLLSDGNTKQKGMDSVIQVCKRLLPFWMFVPFLILSNKLGIGGFLYDYIASRRQIVPAAHCNENACHIHEMEITNHDSQDSE